MKYMIMMFGGMGASLSTRTPEWIKGMGELMMTIQGELADAGELGGRAWARRPHAGQDGPVRGRRAGGDRRPVRGDQGVAGRVLDRRREAEERALEIVSRVVAYTELSDGGPAGHARVRPRLSMTAARDRGPAARAGAAGPRRARPPARAVRRVRGRRAGGAARRGRAVARRGRARQPAGLAGDRRPAAAGRPAGAATAPAGAARSAHRARSTPPIADG